MRVWRGERGDPLQECKREGLGSRSVDPCPGVQISTPVPRPWVPVPTVSEADDGRHPGEAPRSLRPFPGPPPSGPHPFLPCTHIKFLWSRQRPEGTEARGGGEGELCVYYIVCASIRTVDRLGFKPLVRAFRCRCRVGPSSTDQDGLRGLDPVPGTRDGRGRGWRRGRDGTGPSDTPKRQRDPSSRPTDLTPSTIHTPRPG